MIEWTGLLSRERLPWLVVGLSSMIGLIPLWASPYLVMQDVPGHVELGCHIVALWRDDPAFTKLLFQHPQPWANSLPSVLLAAILLVVPSYAAIKIALSLYVVAWPLSIAVLLRAYGRSPWLALVCLPTTFGMGWAFGFYNFLLAMPVFSLTLVAARAFAREGGARRGLALAAVLSLLFLSHSLLWLLACGLTGLALLVYAPKLLVAVKRLWPLLATGAVAAPFFSKTLGVGPKGATSFSGPEKQLERAWRNLGELNASHGDEIAWSAAAVALVLLFLAAGREALADRGRDRLALLGFAGVLFCGYLFGPSGLPQVSIVAERLLVFAVVLFVAVAPAPRGRLVPALAAWMVAAASVQAVDLARMYRGFSREEMGDFVALLDRAPEGGRLATFYASTGSKWGIHNAMWHWPKLHCLTGRGFTDDTFAYRETAFVELTPEARKAGFRAPPTRMQAGSVTRYDALLVRGDERHVKPVASVLEPLGEAGSWRLYKVKKPPR